MKVFKYIWDTLLGATGLAVKHLVLPPLKVVCRLKWLMSLLIVAVLIHSVTVFFRSEFGHMVAQRIQVVTLDSELWRLNSVAETRSKQLVDLNNKRQEVERSFADRKQELKQANKDLNNQKLLLKERVQEVDSALIVLTQLTEKLKGLPAAQQAKELLEQSIEDAQAALTNLPTTVVSETETDPDSKDELASTEQDDDSAKTNQEVETRQNVRTFFWFLAGVSLSLGLVLLITGINEVFSTSVADGMAIFWGGLILALGFVISLILLMASNA